MSFQVGIGSLGGTVFFQVGLSTPLRTMIYIYIYIYIYMYVYIYIYLYSDAMKTIQCAQNSASTKTHSNMEVNVMRQNFQILHGKKMPTLKRILCGIY